MGSWFVWFTAYKVKDIFRNRKKNVLFSFNNPINLSLPMLRTKNPEWKGVLPISFGIIICCDTGVWRFTYLYKECIFEQRRGAACRAFTTMEQWESAARLQFTRCENGNVWQNGLPFARNLYNQWQENREMEQDEKNVKHEGMAIKGITFNFAFC